MNIEIKTFMPTTAKTDLGESHHDQGRRNCVISHSTELLPVLIIDILIC